MWEVGRNVLINKFRIKGQRRISEYWLNSGFVADGTVIGDIYRRSKGFKFRLRLGGRMGVNVC